MATAEDVLDAQHTLVEEQLDDDQFLLDLFGMQATLEQHRKETIDAWIEFLARFDPQKDRADWDWPQRPETD